MLIHLGVRLAFSACHPDPAETEEGPRIGGQLTQVALRDAAA